jgi:hypothetical protein
MDDSEVRALLSHQMTELRNLVQFHRGDTVQAVAALQLNVFWRATCHLAKIIDTEDLSAEQREIAASLVRLSRDTITLKREEFVIHGPVDDPGRWSDDGYGRDGGAGVPVPVVPIVPPRVGRDAKPFPPEDLLPDSAERQT